MKKYLLFDLDGTLTDPKEGICTCVQYALASFGIQEPDLDKLEPFIGPPLKDSFMKFYDMDAEQAEAAIGKYRERFQEQGIFENKLYDGIPEMLRALNSKGMFMAVASSKPTVFVRRILEHFQIAKYFKVVVGSELDGTRSNKEEVVSEALRQLFDQRPVEKDQVYMIGDRCFDVEGAHAMGIEAVGVTYGYGSMEELKEVKADYIVRSVVELQKFLLRGTDEKKLTPSQRLWQLALPFLLFIMMRNIVINFAAMIMASLGQSGGGSSFLYVWDEEGKLVGMTGNAGAIISAVGFLTAGAAVFQIARKTIGKAAEDRKLLYIREEPRQNYILLAVAAMGLVLGLNLLLSLVGMVGSSENYQAVAENQYAAWLPLGLFCFGVVTPIAEELLFRGIFYNCCRRYMKLQAAMIMSAALFALYHGNSVQGIYAFFMGCFIVFAYEYFGEYKVAVFVHIFANVLAYLVSSVGIQVPAALQWVICVISLLAAAGSIFALYRQKKIF